MKKRIRGLAAHPSFWFLTICMFGLNPVSAHASTPGKKWNFLAEIYLMSLNMNGETGKGDTITVPVDADPGDVFSNLEIGGMAYFEASTEK